MKYLYLLGFSSFKIFCPRKLSNFHWAGQFVGPEPAVYEQMFGYCSWWNYSQNYSSANQIPNYWGGKKPSKIRVSCWPRPRHISLFPLFAIQWLRRYFSRFKQRYNMPNTLGAVDGTHVAIAKPPLNHPTAPGNLFYHRKGYYSINCQIVSNFYNLPTYLHGLIFDPL